MEYRRDDLAGQVRWYVYDGLGSVVGELDPSGNLTASKKYDVYGAERAGGTGTASSRQGFCGSLGHIADAETGLVYMRARYYDPNVGRFVSEDSAYDGFNWFVYCDSNPINATDSSGHAIDLHTLMTIYGEISRMVEPGKPALGYNAGVAWQNRKMLIQEARDKIDDLLHRGKSEFGRGAVKAKKGQSKSGIDLGSEEAAASFDSMMGANDVASAVALKGVIDVIEGLGMEGEGI